MNRRKFLFNTSGLALSVWISPGQIPLIKDKMDRIGLGTVLFRYRFKQTKPKEIDQITDELRLEAIPAYYRKRFNIRKLEFWSNHFESLDQAYLGQLKSAIRAAGSSLVNVQVDSSYNLANNDEAERQKSIVHVKSWMDAVSFLGSECIRVNPGAGGGNPERSIESMKELNAYARSRKLILLTENHFGIEMNPDLHVRIVKEAGPGNIYTLPDFGNYPKATMFESLEKIMPYAYLISAKAALFNDKMEHVSYDFDKCVQLAERMGFKGVYSLEQWDAKYQPVDYEKVTDWLIGRVLANI